jgi:putative hydrolase of the HAD superfamily
MKLRYLLLDLDQTVYPASSGLLPAINRRMSSFVSDFLNISPEEAAALRRELSGRYGTTVSGLMELYGLSDPAGFIAYAHDLDIGSFLAPDPGLQAALQSLPCPVSILTNSPAGHASKVLARLGIAGCFEHIFDISFNGYRGKPVLSTYTRVLAAIGMKAGEVLFVDDRLDYLLPFHGLGGRVLLCEENGGQPAESGPPEIERIASLKQLPELLAARCG